MRKLLLITMCFAVALLFSSVAYGFHDKGVARCNACHTMHNSENGAPKDAAAPLGNQNLLIKATPSDVCLTCHGDGLGREYPSVTYTPLSPPPQTGAGSFIFLNALNLNERSGVIPSSAAGHNLNAPSRSAGPDGTLTTAPGGSYLSADMGCSSCHDPHGNQSFRLLYGVGHVHAGNATFANAAPIADGIGFSAETNILHTAYKSGMSAWCGNCHGDYHQNSGGRLEHKSGVTGIMSSEVTGNYGRYNGTADYATGSVGTSYLAAVPFEDPGMTTTSTGGPTAISQVSCISCHRAHATSAPDAGRWDFNVTYLAKDGVTSLTYAIPNPYPDLDPLVPVQRSLCNKCHVKDAGDLGSNP
jgi:hypothetical protein